MNTPVPRFKERNIAKIEQHEKDLLRQPSYHIQFYIVPNNYNQSLCPISVFEDPHTHIC